MSACDDARGDDLLFGDRLYSRSANGIFVVDKNGVKWEVAPGVMLVRFSPSSSPAQIGEFADSHGLTLRQHPANSSGYLLFDYEEGRDAVEILTDLLNDPAVLDACPDTKVRLFGGDDVYYPNQWNLRKMRMDKAWEITTGNSDVKIAIIDEGIDYWHEDLTSAMWWNPNDAHGDGIDNDADSLWYGQPMIDDFTGWDFVSGDNKPLPALTGDDHGTPVAGVAFATRNNSVGLAGVLGAEGSNGPKMMSIRGSIYAAYVSKAIEYAWRKGADVINMSFGVLDDTSNAVAAQIDSAAAHGVIVVAAVGNQGDWVYPLSKVAFPATHPSVIAVGATDSNDVHLDYSSMGDEIDIVAPGGHRTDPEIHLWTTDNYQTTGDNNPTKCLCPAENPKYYSLFTGTSASSPEVAAIAALIRSHRPGLTPAEVRQRLIDSALDLGDAGPDTVYGYGRADAYRALTEWGTITGNVTWRPEDTADATRYVAGDLTIASGATLTIMPGTIIRIASTDDLASGVDTARVEFNVDGELVADGTASDPIIFESWDPQTTEDWVGFYLSADGEGAEFEHCIIRNAEIAIDAYAPVTLRDVTIEEVADAAVSMSGTTLTVDASTIGPSDGDCIRLTNTTATIDSTTVQGYFAYGVYATGNHALDITNCEFLGDSIGVYVASNWTNGVIANSRFEDNHAAISYYSSVEPDIVECTITGNTVGVRCDYYSSPTIEYCLTSTNYAGNITGNGSGIFCTDHSDPRIGYCNISQNGVGVGAFDDSEPSLQLHPNTLVSNTSHHVVNLTEGVTIGAQVCYWYLNTGAPNYYPKSTKIMGSVDYTNALASPDSINPAFMLSLPVPTPPKLVTALGRAHPNPFNPSIQIPYSLATAGAVEIAIYDVAGRRVRTLIREERVAGEFSTVWDGVSDRGNRAASAVYFVRMRAGEYVNSQKIVLLK